jgi:hypothetical protein
MNKLIALTTALAAAAVAGNKYSIQTSGTAGAGQILVIFDSSAAPSSMDAGKAAYWSIEAETDSGPAAGKILGNPVVGSKYPYAVVPQVTLTVQFFDGNIWSADFPPGAQSYTVKYSQGGQTAILTTPCKPAAPTQGRGSSTNDLNLFGGINSGVGTKPTYSINSSLDFHPLGNGFGVAASVKTDNRPKVDPDSFSGTLDYRRLLSTPTSSGEQIVFQGALLQLDYAGVEFDRKGHNLNFISSPYIVLPFDFHSASGGSVVNIIGFDLKLGMEAGHNFRNSLNGNGYGGFVRTLGGGALNVTLRSVPGFTKVVLSSNYEVRLPDKAELFGTTNGAGVTSYTYSKKARNWVSTSASFYFNKQWSFTVQHSYGSLPPAFNFTDQQVSLGLKFALKGN